MKNQPAGGVDVTGQVVPLGRITGVYGVRGWIKLVSQFEPPEALLSISPWLLRREGAWQPVEVAEARCLGKSLVARLVPYDDRDQARELIGADIGLYREQLPPAAPGEYYWIDLTGLVVVNKEGVSLGKVDHLIETGAHDVLVVTGERERLIPFVRDRVVLDVDLAAGVIRVDWNPEF